MTLRLSTRATELAHSGIREVMNKALSTPDAIRLELGEPGFPTPEHIVEAAHAAATSGRTKYAPTPGLPELREALATKVTTLNGYDADQGQVIVTQGAVEGIYSTLLGVLDPGDEMLIPDPAWPNFAMASGLVSARAVPYQLKPEHGFVPVVEELDKLVTPRTKVLLLNSPSNPCGAVIDPSGLAEIVAWATKRNLWILSDECYDAITFEQPNVSPATLAPDRVISIYSFSKTYAMTGWRVGYVVAPDALSGVIARIQEPLISCVATPVQLAALAAVQGDQTPVEDMRNAYRQRRDHVLGVLNGAGIRNHRPEGAFYVWFDIEPTALASRDFALGLLDLEQVAIAPGSAFGQAGEGWARISIAQDPKALIEGTGRIVRYWKGLCG